MLVGKARLILGLATMFIAASVSGQVPDGTADQGKIVVYRAGTIVGAALGCPIRYEGRELVELGRNKYAELPVTAGDYVLTNKTSSVEVRVKAGQTRYVRCQIKSGFMTGRADLQIVDQASFDEHGADYERKEPAFKIQ